jgi:putative SOS response-associated peptidase YedK
MCVTFTPAKPTAVQRLTGRAVDFEYPQHAYPGYAAPIVVKAASSSGGATDTSNRPGLDVVSAQFGLIPVWSKDRNFGKRTYNARSETVAEKPSYRGAWRARRFCLVPMERFYEPCWETGKAVKWSIHRRDSEAFAVAGIWENWTDRATGEIVTSFSMLTINGDGHEVMGRFHRPGDELRSLVIVKPENWNDWVTATTEQAREMLLPMKPADFTAQPVTAFEAASEQQTGLLGVD